MKTILAVNELTPQKKKGIMFVVFILGLVQNFSSNMFNTTGTAIVAQLSGIEYYTLQFTIFTLVSGIFIPMFGNLGDIQGRRRWLAIGAALFVVGSLTMCAAPHHAGDPDRPRDRLRCSGHYERKLSDAYRRDQQ